MSADSSSPGKPPPRRSFQQFLVPLVLLGIAGGAVALIAMMPGDQAPPEEEPPPPTNVVVQTVAARPRMPDTLTIAATVEPDLVVDVPCEVTGRVSRYGEHTEAGQVGDRSFEPGDTIEEGDPVTAGTVIVQLNDELLQAAYAQAKAKLEYDQRELERIARLDPGAQAENELDNARAQRDISQAALNEVALNLERTTIEAPISGVLNELPLEIGELAAPGDVVAQIVVIDRVKVVVNVPERDIDYLRVGDTAEILVGPEQRTVVPGEITFISAMADRATNTTRVEITVDNHDRQLRSGRIVRARLTRRVLEDALMIPLEAVIPLERGYVVYVVQGEQAERREVELGLLRGSAVQVTDGLVAGDRLIVKGHRYVAPGQQVQVVTEQ